MVSCMQGCPAQNPQHRIPGLVREFPRGQAKVEASVRTAAERLKSEQRSGVYPLPFRQGQIGFHGIFVPSPPASLQ